MKKYFDSIKKHLKNELAKSAKDYLVTGLSLFHSRGSRGIQPSIGNLGTAIELMLKAFIADNNPLLIFKEIPNELKVLFSCPGTKLEGFNWRRYDSDLRSFAFKTIELDECISFFYIFFPLSKNLLQPYFRHLSNCRNVSLHAALPSFQIYDLERTAYLTLNVHKILNETKVFGYSAYYPTENDKKFFSSFDAERADRVRKKIKEAKQMSKGLDHDMSFLCTEGWDTYTTDCPICDSEGLLLGYTDIYATGDQENLDYGLEFYADSFECVCCKLKLDDVKELKLAGMAIAYDRSKDLDKWCEENPLELGDVY